MTPRIRVCLASGICLAGLATTLGSQRPGAAQARSYVVQPGDSLSAIAARAHRSQGELARLNGIADPDHLQAGQVLTIPDGSDTFEPGRPTYQDPVADYREPAAGYGARAAYQAPVAGYRTRAVYQPASSATYPGQHVPTVGQRTPASLQQTSGRYASGDYNDGSALTAVPGTGSSYVVRPGDTLGALSDRFGVPLATLAAANGILRPEFVQVGQHLTIPARASIAGVAAAAGAGSASNVTTGAVGTGQPTMQSTPVAIAATAVAPPARSTSGAGIAAASASGGGVGALLAAEAQAYRIDPALVKAVAWQESGWRMVVAADGGIGVMQLMPATAAWVGPALLGRTIDPYNLQDNVQAGVALLASYLQTYGGNVQQALAAYNEGPQNLTRGILLSTAQYIASVLSLRTGYAQ